VAEVGFDAVNTAAYSPRPGTPAALWQDQVPEEIKSDRLQRLNHLVAQTAYERSQRYLHCVETVLVEGTNPKDPQQLMGRTSGNRLTFFAPETGKALDDYLGKLVPIRITSARAFSLTGEVVKTG